MATVVGVGLLQTGRIALRYSRVGNWAYSTARATVESEINSYEDAIMLKRLQSDLKQSMRDRNKFRSTVIRSVIALHINSEKSTKPVTLTSLIEAAIKQRMQSAQIYTKSGHKDRADGEMAEARLMEEYLPPLMTEEEMQQQIDAAIKVCNESTLRSVMKEIKLPGRVDKAQLVKMIKTTLKS